MRSLLHDRFQQPIWLLLLIFAAIAPKHSEEDAAPKVMCAREGVSPIYVEIRDLQGRPNAIGAVVTIRNQEGYKASAEGFGDPLRVYVGESEGGIFDIKVRKPWHTKATIRGVEVPEDSCGLWASKRVEVTLPLLAGAPAVRQVVAAPYGYGFGRGNMTDRLVAYVEAAPGISRQVVWRSEDTSVVEITPEGILTTQCRARSGSTLVTATSVADPTKRDSVQVSVFRDQNPKRCPAP